MAVIEGKIEVAPEAVDAIEEMIAFRGEPRWLVLEDRLLGRAWVAGYFETRAGATAAWHRLAEVLDPAWLAGEPDWRELPDADWRESYRVHFKAWKSGRLHWVPVWERATFLLPPGEEVVWLDPGMAFGTGNHETTRLCVERLVAFAAKAGVGKAARPQFATQNSPLRVIDAGCGSGILALSA